ncbi:MAG: hypothetical protein ABIU20_02000 [Blastocatellia bacterium]
MNAALNQVRSGKDHFRAKGRRMVRLLPERGKEKLNPGSTANQLDLKVSRQLPVMAKSRRLTKDDIPDSLL